VRRAAAVNIPTPEGYAALAGIPLTSGQTLQSRQAVLGALSFLSDVYPQIKVFQPATPANINGAAIPIGRASVPLVIPDTIWEWRGRLDHRLTAKDTLSFTTQGTSDISPINIFAGNRGFGARFAETNNVFTDKVILSHTRTFSPAWVNEARFGFTSYRGGTDNHDAAPAVAVGSDFTI